MDELSKKIEALLFVSGEGMTVSRLASILKKRDEEIKEGIAELERHLFDGHALTVLKDQDRVSLITSTAVSKLVEDFAKEEFAGELTRAALEALTIVAYKGPMKRSEIDYVRGVNSSFMLRNLLMRGLIERVRDSKDSRAYLYRVSADFLKFLGLASISDLPEYGEYAQKLEEFIKEETVQNA
ncbi:SMC-Scp complex subunit ScpB [Candidatus Giovannonibacteria bacterium RIFCSPLOWO2_01_FULL_44_40]|uniref:SMC-Scp complex subunit ScpB n=1 Tax=Candidatus Giovannonibacteria bacterium RIFCSPHIGHO2_01_FULL_45_23 TaxID=1798325 RepID=A0A1F5VE62_9BACT|nr:MAG: SMC-Scp complex subunit ScpB [Candidatus Giovannonibacteria bacterium RIFCSPHIGHO2_01_FULL_45_23]OGF75256.1 MAG: SMC-Scp complex subunit ScpB [Candidatus Giovannonibacteria bacterium RIFCSPHIGHO2_02_FULL_45_13]OGF79930.1 MAG: SMC-Scp complex subunit ScpB [Candidatus Giovannonibacteria bacterium RIFCSPLOWO2_01_FULL_44_40]